MKGKDLGVKTWPPDAWRIGGATMWGWFSYDPDLDTLYYGTANPGPWNANQRPGDNLWTTTLFARDPDDGHAKWAYQFNPHDLWDHDEIQENVLVDLELDGKTRKVLLHPGRNGYMYVIDRATGEVLSADAYDTVNAYKGVDLKIGPHHSQRGAEARSRHDRHATSVPQRRARRTGSHRRGRRAPSCSTCRISICA